MSSADKDQRKDFGCVSAMESEYLVKTCPTESVTKAASVKLQVVQQANTQITPEHL